MADRQRADTFADPADPNRSRVNLLNWDGRGTPEGMFPPRKEEP
jgi:nitrate reductase beta subunit